MRIVPKAGFDKIRDPKTRQFLPAEGREVPDNDLFWHRLLQDGDVFDAAVVEQQKRDEENAQKKAEAEHNNEHHDGDQGDNH